MISDYKILKAIQDDLLSFAMPSHFEGFFIDFCEWVIREWEHRNALALHEKASTTESVPPSYRTTFNLKDPGCTYRTFINSHPGYGYATHASLAFDHFASQTMEKRLYEFFHESMRLRALVFLKDRYRHVDPESYWDRIFSDGFAAESEKVLVDAINELFGFYAEAARPYTCPPDPSLNDCRYASWTLADFKTTAGLVRGLGGERLGKVAMAAGKLFVLYKGGLDATSLKKPLSQKGAIA
ncbi:MAG: hypothetical protein H7249_16215 [Chitinophagaceae bacterium]|nr:hypothetical protein [Oligoflexus sp.]